MRTSLCAVALLSVALLGAGCKKGPDLVGKWTASQGGSNVDFEFQPENKFSIATKLGTNSMTATGTYKLEGEKLSLTTTDVQMPGLPPALLAQAKKSPEFSKPKDVTIKFVSDDEVSLSGLATPGASAQAVTLKRVK